MKIFKKYIMKNVIRQIKQQMCLKLHILYVQLLFKFMQASWQLAAPCTPSMGDSSSLLQFPISYSIDFDNQIQRQSSSDWQQ